MTAYLVRRLLWLPILLLIVAFLTFVLGYYGPGDPVQLLLGQHSNPEAVERLRHELGLDRPLPVQFADYVWRALHGDFGESITMSRGRPVSDLLKRSLSITLQLNAVVLLVSVVVGVPLGVLAALKRNTWLDYLSMTGVVIAISFPTFLIAPILLWLFAYKWRVLPPGGWNGIFSRNIILPVLVMSAGPIAVFARQTRANLIEVLSQEYIRTAYAKGLHERRIFFVHALRNALIPLLTILGLMLGSLVVGSFITETIFGIPGVGRLAFQAFFSRDYPVIMALVLLIAVGYAVANLVVDILYAFVDPRIRYQ